jgi:hypothetical protein
MLSFGTPRPVRVKRNRDNRVATRISSYAAPNRLTRMALSWHGEGRVPVTASTAVTDVLPGRLAHGVPMTHTRRARASGCFEYVTVRLAFAGHEGHGATGRSAKPG